MKKFEQGEDSDADCVQRSGKMVVVETLLDIWKKQNHRVLLFSQSKKASCQLFQRLYNKPYLIFGFPVFLDVEHAGRPH